MGGCSFRSPDQPLNVNENPSTNTPDNTVSDELEIVMGQTIYVPIYSHVYHENKNSSFDLAATLSIRNTDLNHPLIITKVDYYNSEGKLVKNYLETPITLNALASTDFIVDRTDTSGGSGANFIVEWIAQTKVSEPIVESIMISARSNQGISFISTGKVIGEINNE